MDNLTIWSKYATQNHMTYGQCKVAVQNGLLPPPRGLRKPKMRRTYTEPTADEPPARFNLDGSPRKQQSRKGKCGNCVICGGQFVARTCRQVTCGAEDCKVRYRRLSSLEYYYRNLEKKG